MKVLVAGATGRTGAKIVEELVNREIPVKALVRDLAKGQQMLSTQVELVVGDVLQPQSLATAVSGCSVLICATGAKPSFNPTEPLRVDFLGTKNLVDTAKENGIRHFVLVSSLCVSKFFHPLNLFWLILVWKKQGEKYLQKSGLTYTIVRPGGLNKEDNSDPIIMSSADTLFAKSIPRAKVAQVCVEALLKTSAQNKIVEVITDSMARSKSWEQLFADVA